MHELLSFPGPIHLAYGRKRIIQTTNDVAFERFDFRKDQRVIGSATTNSLEQIAWKEIKWSVLNAKRSGISIPGFRCDEAYPYSSIINRNQSIVVACFSGAKGEDQRRGGVRLFVLDLKVSTVHSLQVTVLPVLILLHYLPYHILLCRLYFHLVSFLSVFE